MIDPSRRLCGVAAGLLAGLAVVAMACSKPANETSGTTPAAPTTANSDTTKVHKADSTATTGARGTVPGPDDGGSDGQTTTSRRSGTSTTGVDRQTFPTITVKPTGGNEEFCNALAEEVNKLAGQMSTSTGGDASGSSDDAASLNMIKQLYQTLTAVAPPGLRGDIETVNNAVQSATSMADLERRGSSAEVISASKNMESWLKANCGISPQVGRSG